MNNLKLLVISFLISISFLAFNNFASAAESLDANQKNHLKELGFSDEVIESMTLDEFTYYEEIIPEDETDSSKSVYKITSNTKGQVMKVEEFDEEQAEFQMSVENRYSIGTMQSCSKPTFCNSSTSWLSMTTSATKLSTGKILLNNSFTWLKLPNFTMTDMVGMNYNDSAVIVPSTTKFSYKYKDTLGTHSVPYKQIANNAHGIAATFNLKSYGADSPPTNHHGYLSVQIQKGNATDIRANVFGQYTHTTGTFTVSLSIRSGDISLGFLTKETKMPSTALVVTY